MRVKNVITTMPKMERVSQKSVQQEVHTLLTLTENIVIRITVQAVHDRGDMKYENRTSMD